MSSQQAKAQKQNPIPVAGNDEAVFWMQEVACEADGTPRLKPVANDTLYDYLESRYGGGFAQWVVDGMDRRRA